MNLRELEIFRAIMRSGSITEAARILGISQPAVSTALRHAEDRLGMQLFRRARGRIDPTPEALSLFPEVEALFQKYRTIQNYADDLRAAHSGLLSLAATPTLSYAYLAGAIGRFRQKRPHVRVVIEVTQTRQIVELAGTRQIDLGIISAPLREANMVSEELAPAELVTIMRKDHPLARRRTVRPVDIRDFQLITNTHHFLYLVLEQTFRRYGLDLNVAIAVNHNVTTCLLLQDSDAVAIVDPWMPMDLLPALIRRPFRPRIEIGARIVWSDARPMSRLAQEFVRELRDNVLAPECDAASPTVAS